MDKWQKLLSVVAVTGSMISASTLAQQTPETFDVTLLWDDVTHASQFQLEEQKQNADESWTAWTPVEGDLGPDFDPTSSDNRLKRALTREGGNYRYRVIGCITDDSQASPLVLCNEDIATYSATTDVLVEANVELNLPEAYVETAPAPDSSLTLPSVNGELVGLTAGSFRVDESGSATYSIPFTLPQGIAGVTPELGLNYSSASGNGHVGIGWSISGLSAITRCRKTWEQDGEEGALKLNSDDRFCLNGQRLKMVSSNTTYGEDGAEYRTEIDGFSKIVSRGTAGTGPAYFEVYGPDGSLSYYGAQDISTSARNDAIQKSGDTGITWMLASISDNLKLAGNSIYYYYNQGISSLGSNEIVLTSVEYSGNTVAFSYDIRVDTFNTADGRYDKTKGFRNGELVETTQLLDNVTISNHDGDKLRRYNLVYGHNETAKLNRVTSVTECGFVGETESCLPATVFEWNGVRPQTSFTTGAQRDMTYDGLETAFPFDIDGNGYPDLLYASKSGSTVTVYAMYNTNVSLGTPQSLFTFTNHSSSDGEHPVTLLPADLDGDGHMELVYYNYLGGKYEWMYYDSNATTTSKFRTLGYDTDEIGKKISLHDLNGDAYPDIIGFNSAAVSRTNIKVAINNADGTFGTVHSVPLPDRTDKFPGRIYSESLILGRNSAKLPPVDVDGDGKADLIIHFEDLFEDDNQTTEQRWGVFRLVEHGNSYRLEEFDILDKASLSLASLFDSFYAADLNADGLSDIVALRKNQASSIVFYSDGTELSFTRSVTMSNHGDKLSGLQFIDVNQDGLLDFMYFDTDSKEWRTSLQKRDLTFEASYAVATEQDSFKNFTFIADWNADGLFGLTGLDVGAKKLRYRLNSVQAHGFAANRIKTITNGFGIPTFIEYQSMNMNAVYKKGTGANTIKETCQSENWVHSNCSPFFDIKSPQHLVYKVGNISAGHNVTGGDRYVWQEYHYEGMRAQSGGRGALGFEKITTRDVQRGIYTETTYEQVFPLTGMPKSTKQYKGSGLVSAPVFEFTLSESSNVNDFMILNDGKTYFPFIKSSNEDSFAVNNLGTASQKNRRVVTTNTYQKYSSANSAIAADATGQPKSTNGNHVNLQQVVVQTQNASNATQGTVTTTNTFVDENVANWWLNRVTGTSVRHQRVSGAGDLDITRNSSFTYDAANGMLKTEVVASGLGAALQLTTLHCYDAKGNEIGTHSYSNHFTVDCTTDPTTLDTTDDPQKVYRFKGYEFDSDDRYPVETKDAFGFKSRTVNDIAGEYQINKFGSPTSVKDINNVVTKTAYDALGNRTATVNSLGQTSAVERAFLGDGPTSSLGEPALGTGDVYYFVERKRGSGKPTTFAYFDQLGREIAKATQGFDGTYVQQVTRYDKYSRQVATSLPFYADEASSAVFTTNEYDLYSRLTTTSLPIGSASTISNHTYSDDGFEVTKASSSDYNNYAVSQERTEISNLFGETAEVQESGITGSVLYQYDAVGNLTQVTGVTGSVISTEYDDYGRKIKMTDPDKGVYQYAYNALGELTVQKDGLDGETNLGTTTNYRDSLGRTVERNVKKGSVDESTNYIFAVNNVNSHLLQQESLPDSNAASKQYFYDDFGRVSVVRTQLEEGTFAQRTTYDEFGRVFQVFDADDAHENACEKVGADFVGTCFGVRNHYNAYGYLYKKEEARYSGATASNENKMVFYEVAGTGGVRPMDAQGNVTRSAINNGTVVTTKAFHPVTGFNTDIDTTSGGNLIQSVDYKYDGFGNLRGRDNIASGYNETFGYDAAYRLESVDASGANAMGDVDLTYDHNGNIKTKSDVQSGATYTYNSKPSVCSAGNVTAGPHAASSVGSFNYCYDNNGNQTHFYDGNSQNDLKRSITYSHFDKPLVIDSHGDGKTYFSYDAGRSRYKRSTTKDSETTTTYYVGNTEIVFKGGVRTETRRYIPGGISTLYLDTSVVKTRYLHKDNLGSIDTITNEEGEIIEKLYFDAWGKQSRLPTTTNWSAQAQAQKALTLTDVAGITERGFTGHEHVKHADIIHMNGRIYDPTLGRFLQADPHIQAPMNSQNYNRYSYVLNNPMSYTDPSGYFFKSLFKFVKKYWRVIAAAVVTYFTAGAASGWAASWGFAAGTAANGAIAGAIAGAAGGFVATGSLKGALRGAFSGAVFGAIGASFNGEAGSGFFAEGGIGHIGSHALTGGIMSELQGGKFGHGFWSAGLTKGLNVNGMIDSFGTVYDAARIAVSAIIGGTISKITGGKFGNGAVSAAMGQMLNGNSQIKGAKNNPIGFKAPGSIPIEGMDGKWYWADATMHAKNFGSDYLAKQTGEKMSDYIETTEEEVVQAVSVVASVGTLGTGTVFYGSVVTLAGIAVYEPTPANVMNLGLGIGGKLVGPLDDFLYPGATPIANMIDATGAVSTVTSVVQPPCQVPYRC